MFLAPPLVPTATLPTCTGAVKLSEWLAGSDPGCIEEPIIGQFRP